MQDIYLKALNEADLKAALPAWLCRADGYYVTASPHHALDVVGVLYRMDSVESQEAEPAPPVALDGFHANLRLYEGIQLPEALQALRIEPPALPKRVFAA